MTLPDTPRPTRPTRHYAHHLLAVQGLLAALAIAAFAAGFQFHKGWTWVGIAFVVMIPLATASVRERFHQEQQILRHWVLVSAQVTKVQNSGGSDSSRVTLYLSYECNGKGHEGVKSISDSQPIDVAVPVWLLVNQDKSKEYRVFDDIRFVEIDPTSLASNGI